MTHQAALSPLCRTLLLGALVLAVLAPQQALAQPDRPRIVVAVMASGDVPPGIDRDIQDLFLTALADQGTHDLVDREAVYELTDLQGDVDLLLCVTRAECIERLYEEHRFEHYVLVKVTELDRELEFTYATFNYRNRESIVFGDRYRVDIRNNAEFVNRAFAVAEGLELKPLDGQPGEPTSDCATVLCPRTQRCELGRCVEADPGDDVHAVADPGEPIDWLLVGGITTGVVGLGATVAAIVLYVDRESRIDSFAASYERSGAARIADMDQRKAHEEVDGINANTVAAHVLLGVGIAATLAGAGLLTWALVDGGDAPPGTARDSGARLTVQPGMLPGGAALGATISF